MEADLAVELNHTIVSATDPAASARFLTGMFGLGAPTRLGPFIVVTTANDVSMDFLAADEIHPQHYCFLVSEAEFDAIYDRITERSLDHWADPGRTRPGTINHHDGGRGVYFEDPDGHLLEAITRPYGSGGREGRSG